ncbi:GCN5-related N-acetyltransferase protein [Rhizobium etli]|uniref:GCN5-related N-acetyltransferase protein n=1 Tax=Rhizobium etli TaxID=29449 RepID=A0AAN1EJF2_RHIET|nr:hypothetical protein [Rhizobium etli]ARQ09745.1 GCN5-related N-acetyltransferase protein [Rhizobium etli]
MDKDLRFEPVTADRWNDFETLFGNRGLSHRLLAGAIDHARRQGARLLEACPIDHVKQSKSVTLCIGSTVVFEAAGFETVAMRKDGRPLMRLELRG